MPRISSVIEAWRLASIWWLKTGAAPVAHLATSSRVLARELCDRAGPQARATARRANTSARCPIGFRSGVRLARHAVRLRMYNHDTTDAPLSPSANASIEHVRDMSGERVNPVALVRD